MSVKKRELPIQRLVDTSVAVTPGTHAAVIRYMEDHGKSSVREAYRSLIAHALVNLNYPIRAAE